MNLVLSPEDTAAAAGGSGDAELSAPDFRRWLSQVQAALSLDASAAADPVGEPAVQRDAREPRPRADLSAPTRKHGHTD